MSGRFATALGCLALAAAALAGCGGDEGGEIPPEEATQLQTALDELESAAGAEECEAAREALARFADRAGGMDGVDEAVRERLDQGAERLSALVHRDLCEPQADEAEEPVVPVPVAPPPEDGDDDDDDDKPKKEKPEKDEGDGDENGKGEDGEDGGGPPPQPPGQDGEPPPGQDEGDGGVEDPGGTGGTETGTGTDEVTP